MPKVIARSASGTSQMAAHNAVVENNEVKLGRLVDGEVLAALLRKKSNKTSGDDDQRKRNIKTIEGKECHACDEPIDSALEGAPGHAQQRLDDDGEDGGLYAEENRFHPGQIAEGGVEHG